MIAGIEVLKLAVIIVCALAGMSLQMCLWPEMEDIADPELKALAESSPMTVLRSRTPTSSHPNTDH